MDKKETRFFYEVNLQIEESIRDSYLKWLRLHIQEMLQLPYFLNAVAYHCESTPLTPQGYFDVSVKYELKSRESLQHYFERDADRMRHDGIQRFGSRFKAQRRVLKEMGPLDFETE